MTETLLHVTARTRGPARLDDVEIDAPDPSIDALVALGVRAPVLAGGEPTLRADLPALLAAFPGVTLRTDALPFASAATLRDLGVGTLRVVLHSARPDAHDWLVGQKGAARLAMRALLAAAELGIPTEIEATLTRPTASHVAELVVLAEGVKARAVHLVRLAHRGPAAREAIMLAARLALLEDPLELARDAALRGRIALHVHDFPRCVAPRLGDAIGAAPRAHVFTGDPAWAAVRAAYADRYEGRCASCPGAAACVGVPVDYVARFGDAEIVSERPRPERARGDASRNGAPRSVAARAGRPPTTRLRDVRAVVRRGEVEGDPLVDEPSAVPDVLAIALDRPTRVLRAEMIRLAQEGARVLRITGGYDHPAAPALLREAARLPGPEVELAGDLAPLFSWTDAQIFEIAGIRRVVGAVPDAFRDRLARIAKIDVVAIEK